MTSQPRKILRHKGIRPLKRFGQSFLEDLTVIGKIVAVADLQPGDTVVEIGAGLGIMTEMIAKQVQRVVALEIDPYMISILQDRLARLSNVEIVQTDVLKYDFNQVHPGNPSKKLKIVGNVPYNISSQILFHVLAYRSNIETMVIMFQKEMADRITAGPGNKTYGIPSVIAQMYARITQEIHVPSTSFFPIPNVDSTVLKFIMRTRPQYDVGDEDIFATVVKAAFAHRRKTLLNNLRNIDLLNRSLPQATRLLNEAKIDGKRRAETLSIEEFGSLSRTLSEILSKKQGE